MAVAYIVRLEINWNVCGGIDNYENVTQFLFYSYFHNNNNEITNDTKRHISISGL